MQPIKLFITGTDTDVGKTYITVGILNAFKNQKYSTLGIKPVASGCVKSHDQLHNADALSLQENSSILLHYHQINPFALLPPISPNIAAKEAGRLITVQELKQKTQYALQFSADICLVEGIGGWYVPLNHTETMADYVKAIGLKTVLVVGIRLGCLNHALLTYQAMINDGVAVAGWVANCIDPHMSHIEENINTLRELLPAPCLGVVGFQQKAEEGIDLNGFIGIS